MSCFLYDLNFEDYEHKTLIKHVRLIVVSVRQVICLGYNMHLKEQVRINHLNNRVCLGMWVNIRCFVDDACV